MRKSITTTHRKMIRAMVGTKRLADEGFVDWIKRATAIAETAMISACVDSWVTTQAKRHWAWAGRVCRLTDSRWTNKILYWDPPIARKPGRPRVRWADALDDFWKSNGRVEPWKQTARNNATWARLGSAFIKRV